MSNAELFSIVKGGASSVTSVVEIARGHGYDISVAEAKDDIQSQTPGRLADSQLDAIAGGKDSHNATASTYTAAKTVSVEAETAVTTATVEAEAVVLAESRGETTSVAIIPPINGESMSYCKFRLTRGSNHLESGNSKG